MNLLYSLFAVSEAPVEAPKPKKYESHAELTVKTDEQKKEEVNCFLSDIAKLHLKAIWKEL